jgi:DNA-binding transcriptional LysR family regulator
MPNVTARQLQVFVDAAETLSFARVAERLGLTASAISFQIRQVELQTGATLFERIGRRVALTEAGRVLLGQARPVLQSMRDLDEAMLGLQRTGGGRVRLGLVSTAIYIVPHLMARFRTAAPGVTVLLREGNRSDTLALLLAGEVDLAIMGQPPNPTGVLAARFAAHPSVIIAGPGHGLCGAEAVHAIALAREGFIVREEGSGTRALSDSFFQAAGFAPRVVMETSSNEMIKQAVMAGTGLALVSEHTISLERSLGLLKVLAVEGFPVMRSWFVVQRKTSPPLPAQAMLRQYLIEHGQNIIDEIEERNNRQKKAVLF